MQKPSSTVNYLSLTPQSTPLTVLSSLNMPVIFPNSYLQSTTTYVHIQSAKLENFLYDDLTTNFPLFAD